MDPHRLSRAGDRRRGSQVERSFTPRDAHGTLGHVATSESIEPWLSPDSMIN